MNTRAGNNRIKSIAIVGAGMAGWTVAAGLAKGLSGLGLDILVIDDPDYREIDTYCESCLPASISFFQMLGATQRELMTLMQANYSLANHYQSWAFAGQDYFMPFIDHGFMLNRIEVPQYVFNQYRQGKAINFEDFSLSAVAARQGKFRPAASDPNSLYSTLSYGIQLNTESYTEYLKNVACAAGVKHISTKIIRAQADQQGEEVDALVLDNKTTDWTDDEGKLQADLYIDCTGQQALLVEQTLGRNFISAENESLANASAYFVNPVSRCKYVNTSLKPDTHGWLTFTHTQKYQQIEYFFQSSAATNNQIMQTLGRYGDIEKTLNFRPLKPGRLASFWYKNCIAIGESAANVDSFIVGKNHLVQSAVFRLLTLFPQSLEMLHQQQEFNRLTHLELDHISDFHQLHYHLSNSQPSDFWQQTKKAAISERLQYKLEAFKQRGIIPFYEGETFSAGIWASLLIGAGYWPERHDPMVFNIDNQWIEQQLAKIKSLTAQAANAMPSIGEYMDKISEKQKMQA